MEILTLLASSSTVYDIVSELTEYARDINPQIAREAVKAVGRIALTVSDVNGIVERLLVFLESGYDHIIAETLVQLKDLLRRYPDLGEVFSMGDIKPSRVTEPEARAALIWILGQFGQHISGKTSHEYALTVCVEDAEMYRGIAGAMWGGGGGGGGQL